jgi:hypothetical protein
MTRENKTFFQILWKNTKEIVFILFSILAIVIFGTLLVLWLGDVIGMVTAILCIPALVILLNTYVEFIDGKKNGKISQS